MRIRGRGALIAVHLVLRERPHFLHAAFLFGVRRLAAALQTSILDLRHVAKSSGIETLGRRQGEISCSAVKILLGDQPANTIDNSLHYSRSHASRIPLAHSPSIGSWDLSLGDTLIPIIEKPNLPVGEAVPTRLHTWT